MEPNYSRTGVRFVTICFGVSDTSLLHSSKYSGIDDKSDIDNMLKGRTCQKPESAVKGLLEAYKRGESASTWLIVLDKPAQDITKHVDKAFDIMSTEIL